MVVIEAVWLVIGISVAVIAIAVLIAAISLRGLARDARSLAQSSERLVRVIHDELPPTLGQLRDLTVELEQLTHDLGPRLERADRLADEVEDTLSALRGTLVAAEGIIRGPLDAVDRARQTVRSVGEGIAVGADRLRRAVEDMANRRDDD
jgi:uncharacterized protein YoxC